jgi:molybdate transport system substrate-binding protein
MRKRGIVAGVLVLLCVLAALFAGGCGSTATTTSASATTTSGATTTLAASTTVTTAAPATTTTAASSTTTLPAVPQGDFIISAASSLKAAFTELGTLFEKNTGVKPTFNFAASGVLQKQIEAGAPVEVFASASPKQVDALNKESLVDASTTATFAGNEIVLIVPAASTLGITGFADLTKPEVKKVTTGDPATAPHGVAAIEILTSLKLLDQVKPKLVYSANAAQTMDYVVRGEVDAGIAFLSDAKGNDKVKIVATADQASYTPVKYVITVVKGGKSAASAKAFIDLIMSADGQTILATHGFKPAPK